VPLPEISKPFNFAFPDHIQKIEFVAAGWGYVTKISSVFSQKNRPEQLIVYKNNADNKTYIARCKFDNCEIKKRTLTETNMEESIQVDTIMVTSETDGSLLANVKSSDKKVYTIKPSINKNANIRIKNINIPIPNLFKYFSPFLKADVPIVKQLPVNTTEVLPIADKLYVDTTACIEFLQNFRMNPELLGKLYSVTTPKDKEMVTRLVSKHIFPLEYLVTNDDKQKSGEKQFSKALYNICFSEICNPNDIKMTLRENLLFSFLFRRYFEVYKVVEAIGIKTFLDSITEESNMNDESIIESIIGEIINIVGSQINNLPIGVKCVFKAIKDGFNVLDEHVDRDKLIMVWDAQCLNVLYLRIICPYILSYKNNRFKMISTKLMKLVGKVNTKPTEGIEGNIDSIKKMDLICENSDIDVDFLKSLPYELDDEKLVSTDCDHFIKVYETKEIEFLAASQPT